MSRASSGVYSTSAFHCHLGDKGELERTMCFIRVNIPGEHQ